jgi:glutathione synthase/RimK-type ligase-like ATP-grasp enzyme
MARAGLHREWVPWRDRTVDWDGFDAVLIRSTWDYHEHVDEFVEWAEHVDDVSRLYNPAPVVGWNAHKRYLLDLEASRVPIVPTSVVERTRPETLSNVADRRGWRDVVVKPTVSAGAKGTGRHRVDDPASERALRAILETSDALVQPYLSEIESLGETSMIAIEGTVTHAVCKLPRDGDFRVQPHHGGAEQPTEPTPAELDLAEQALAAVSALASVLYARIDCVTVEGQPTLMELEVIEPALYLPMAPAPVAERLVTCLAERAAAAR